MQRCMRYCRALRERQAVAQAGVLRGLGVEPQDIRVQVPLAGVLKPSYVIVRDRQLHAVVLAIRGTHSLKVEGCSLYRRLHHIPRTTYCLARNRRSGTTTCGRHARHIKAVQGTLAMLCSKQQCCNQCRTCSRASQAQASRTTSWTARAWFWATAISACWLLRAGCCSRRRPNCQPRCATALAMRCALSATPWAAARPRC